MDEITKDELIKRNAIRLAEDHQSHCEGAACNISLMLVAMLLRRAGIDLSAEELTKFA